jgi:hypothetical protein
MVIFAMITTQALAKKAIDPDLNIEIATKKTDNREELHQVNFDKLLRCQILEKN